MPRLSAAQPERSPGCPCSSFALPCGLACNVTRFSSVFLLCSNSHPPSLRRSLVAPLRRRLSARAAASKPSLRAAASSRSRTRSMPARRVCGFTGLLCYRAFGCQVRCACAGRTCCGASKISISAPGCNLVPSHCRHS